MKILNRLIFGVLIYFGQENKLEFLGRKNKIEFWLKDFKIIIKMVNNSAKKSNSNGNNEIGSLLFPEYDLYVDVKKKNNNEEYKKGGLVFPSYELYSVLKKINKKLSLFYTKTGEECDYETIFDSQTRHSNYFVAICKNIRNDISVFKEIKKNDSRVDEFLHNNRLSSKFSSLFDSIYDAFTEAMCSRNFNNEIKNIVRELAYFGVDPFRPHMI